MNEMNSGEMAKEKRKFLKKFYEMTPTISYLNFIS